MTTKPVAIRGFLGGNGELRYTPKGTPVVSVNVGTKIWKEDTPIREQETMWVELNIFGNLALNAVSNLIKGSKITAWGSYKQETYTNKAGQEVVKHRFTVEELYITPVSKDEVASTGFVPEYRDISEPIYDRDNAPF